MRKKEKGKAYCTLCAYLKNLGLLFKKPQHLGIFNMDRFSFYKAIWKV